jgi:hypothetical protein
MIGDILMRAMNGDIDEGRRLLGEFTIDKSGMGLPMRHFASAKTFAEILREHDESIIIELIRNPWEFFDVYNGLKMKPYEFPREIIELYTGF